LELGWQGRLEGMDRNISRRWCGGEFLNPATMAGTNPVAVLLPKVLPVDSRTSSNW
jgi:hypothetical protein